MLNKRLIAFIAAIVLVFAGIYAFAGGDNEGVTNDQKQEETTKPDNKNLPGKIDNEITNEENNETGLNLLPGTYNPILRRPTVSEQPTKPVTNEEKEEETIPSYTIVLEGKEEAEQITIEMGTPISDINFLAFDSTGNNVSGLEIISAIDFNILGLQTLRYRIGTYTGTFNITIEDTIAPTIEFIKDGNDKYVKSDNTKVQIFDISEVSEDSRYMWVKDITNLPDWSAFDKNNLIQDGDLIVTPKGETGLYYLCVRASDKSNNNNSVIKCSKAFYLDNAGPINFKFNPVKHETLEGGGSYNLNSTTVTAYDKEEEEEFSTNQPYRIRYVREYTYGYTDYNLTEVNLSRIGKYRLDYKLCDSNENCNTTYKFIYVQDTTAPTITLKSSFNTRYEAGMEKPDFNNAVEKYSDNIEQKLKLSINDEEVDMNTPGIYPVTFKVTEIETTNWDGSPRTPLLTEVTINIEIIEAKPQGLIFFDKDNPNQKDIGNAWETVEADKKATYVDWVNARSYDEFDNITYIVGSDKECVNGSSCYQIKYKLDKYDKSTPLVTVDAVNMGVPGSYFINYRVYDNTGNSRTRGRWVDVVDTTAPTLNLYVGSQATSANPLYIEVEAGTNLDDIAWKLGYRVYDKVDGTLANHVNATKAFVDDAVIKRFYELDTETNIFNEIAKIDTKKEGTYKIEYSVSDKARNTTNKERIMTIKDTILPTAKIEYSTTEPTNGRVRATIKFSEPIKDTPTFAPNTYTGGGKFVKVSDTEYYIDYWINISFDFNFEDLAGNIGTGSIEITNIDRIKPTAKIEYSTTEPTNGRVRATIKFSEPIKDTPTFAPNTYTGGGKFVKVSDTEYYIDYWININFNFNFEDLAGNIGTYWIEIINIDRIKPEITIIGDNPTTIEAGNEYIDAGATALDNYDGNITSNISTVNPVNTNLVGTYTVTYTVTDSSGNSTTVTRTVEVIAATPKDTTGPTVNFEVVYEPDKSSGWGNVVGIKVTVTDESGINSDSLKYVWTKKKDPQPDFTTNGISFINKNNISKSSDNDKKTLWVIAKDIHGNETINKWSGN